MNQIAVKMLLTALIFMTSIIAIADDATTPPLFIVHFETGPNWDMDLPPAQQLRFGEHSANMNRLRENGTIVFGARYGDLGVIILKEASIAAAKKIIKADPGVQSGIFTFRIEALSVFYPWKL